MKIDYIKEYQYQLRNIINQFSNDLDIKEEEVLKYETVLHTVWYWLDCGGTSKLANALRRDMPDDADR